MKAPQPETEPVTSHRPVCLPLLPSGPDGVRQESIAQSPDLQAEGRRRERDSNPRYSDRVHTLSKRTPSATRSSLLLFCPTLSGESGIRTHGTDMQFNGFRVRPIQPLSHLSTDMSACPRGFEPPASRSAIWRSIQLSYGHRLFGNFFDNLGDGLIATKHVAKYVASGESGI